ncbi:MAG: 2-hydroxychromene-2-carboxylate isomerase [Burkholderiaceae bacterium]|nr:2-hydroxychromene-2-carboxylate isomerase [Burkholderiaceae bacterium]
MPRIECFFDCSSPWTYLGFVNLPAVAAEFDADIRWRPFLVGGVFNTVNPSVYASREQPVPAKSAYMVKSLRDWARLAGVRIEFPPPVFPVNSVTAMRACIALEPEGLLVPFARACFEAYFGRGEDISQDAVLRPLLQALGVDPDATLAAARAPACKDALRANTEELIRRGGFGSPTFYVDGDDMYFGNDALPLVRAALARRS